MRKQIAILLLLAGMLSWCYAQNPPKEVMDVMKDYVKDSTAEDGFLSARHWLENSESISAADIEVGQPIQEYSVKHNMLDTCTDSIPFYKLIEPEDYWIFPIRFKERYLYEVNVSKFQGKWRISGRASLYNDNLWQQMRSAYPESTGINPMLVIVGLSKYLYVKLKGQRKIFYINPGYKKDTLKNTTASSMLTLIDSKELVKYWKKQGKGSGNDLDKIIERLQGQEVKYGGDK